MSASNQKKILVLLGSPRKKGNSTLLANRIIKGAEGAGAAVETVYLHGLDIAPCRACEGCRKKNARDCVVDDDMRPLYDKIRGADALVYASPVYWFTVSAQLKLFIDRCYAFGARDYRELTGKKAGVAMSFGDSDAFNFGGKCPLDNSIGIRYLNLYWQKLAGTDRHIIDGTISCRYRATTCLARIRTANEFL